MLKEAYLRHLLKDDKVRQTLLKGASVMGIGNTATRSGWGISDRTFKPS